MVNVELYYSLIDHNMYVSLLALLIISSFEMTSGGWFNLRLPFFGKGKEGRARRIKNNHNAVGLWNLGNTCYANSIIQALYHCAAFRNQVFSEKFTQNSIGESIQSLFLNMQSKQSNVVDTTDLLQSLQVNVNIQEDAQEFLLKLVNSVEESVESSGKGIKDSPSKSTSSVILGEIEYLYDCVEVNFTKARKQRFLTLSLDMYNFTNVEDSLAKFFDSEFLTGDNKYNTKTHGLQDTEKSCRISRFPDVLCIHLKRFSYDFAMGKLSKVGNFFEFPFDLNMNYSNSNNNNRSNITSGRNYSLKTIVIHDGEANSGHYTCIVNQTNEKSAKKMKGSNWLNLNDHDVSSISEDDVRRLAFGSPGSTSYKSKNAYLLFYTAN